MTEKEKMLSGQIYSAVDKELLDELYATKEVVQRYNSLSPLDNAGRLELLKRLLGHIGDDAVIINQPFYCDYGKQISVGKRFFANFHFTVLDEATVTIGDDCFIGPNVSIYTACHSTDPIERNTRQEWAEPVTIGNNVWECVFLKFTVYSARSESSVTIAQEATRPELSIANTFIRFTFFF